MGLNAAYAGDLSTVRNLLESKVDPEIRVRIKGNNTALNFACRNGNLELVRFLLDSRADVNARNDFAETPLMVAANRARAAVCRTLFDYGADPHAQDENGDNALDFLGIGNSERKQECRDVLRKGGCRPLPR